MDCLCICGNEPNNEMRRNRIITTEKAIIKPMEHCTALYKMELTYVQTRLKGQGNPELALEIQKKDAIFKLLL